MEIQFGISGLGSIKISVVADCIEVIDSVAGKKVMFEEKRGSVSVQVEALPVGGVASGAGVSAVPTVPTVPAVAAAPAVPVASAASSVPLVPSVGSSVDSSGVQAMPRLVPVPMVPSVRGVPASAEVQSSDQLFKRLSTLRKQISSEVKLPPYIIFHDKTLHEMCQHLPIDMEGFREISGVGQARAEKYGSRFVEVIREFVAEAG